MRLQNNIILKILANSAIISFWSLSLNSAEINNLEKQTLSPDKIEINADSKKSDLSHPISESESVFVFQLLKKSLKELHNIYFQGNKWILKNSKIKNESVFKWIDSQLGYQLQGTHFQITKMNKTTVSEIEFYREKKKNTDKNLNLKTDADSFWIKWSQLEPQAELWRISINPSKNGESLGTSVLVLKNQNEMYCDIWFQNKTTSNNPLKTNTKSGPTKSRLVKVNDENNQIAKIQCHNLATSLSGEEFIEYTDFEYARNSLNGPNNLFIKGNHFKDFRDKLQRPVESPQYDFILTVPHKGTMSLKEVVRLKKTKTVKADQSNSENQSTNTAQLPSNPKEIKRDKIRSKEEAGMEMIEIKTPTPQGVESPESVEPSNSELDKPNSDEGASATQNPNNDVDTEFPTDR